MISIVITSFNEPETIGKAIECFLKQDINEKYEIIISSPESDKKTSEIVNRYIKKNNQVKLFKDPGKGKSYAINLLLPKLKGEIIILTDGDVYVSGNSVNEILSKFEDSKVGCVSGQPLSQNSRENMLGYWSHLLCYAAHQLRKQRDEKNQFLECSGYLWAFRNNIIRKFPTDIAEDTIVPIMFFLKGYKIKYAAEARVYVKFPDKFNDFIKQKRRAAASHGTIFRYVNPKNIPRMKSLKNEIMQGYILFLYPKNLKEFFYTLLLFPVRFYIWMNLLYNQKIKKRYYTDAWKRVESTK